MAGSSGTTSMQGPPQMHQLQQRTQSVPGAASGSVSGGSQQPPKKKRRLADKNLHPGVSLVESFETPGLAWVGIAEGVGADGR